jgi:hypothetical protein
MVGSQISVPVEMFIKNPCSRSQILLGFEAINARSVL